MRLVLKIRMYFQKDIDSINQRRATKIVKEIKYLEYHERIELTSSKVEKDLRYICPVI